MAVAARTMTAESPVEMRLGRLEDQVGFLRSDMSDTKADVRRLDVKIDGVRDSLLRVVQSSADVRESVAALLAKVQHIDEKTSAFENRLDRTENALTARIDEKTSALEARIDHTEEALTARIDEKTSALEARIDHTEEALTARIDEKTSALEARIDHTKKTLTARIDEKTSALEVRIDHTEKTLTACIDEKTSALEARIDHTKKDLTARLDEKSSALLDRMDAQFDRKFFRATAILVGAAPVIYGAIVFLQKLSLDAAQIAGIGIAAGVLIWGGALYVTRRDSHRARSAA